MAAERIIGHASCYNGYLIRSMILHSWLVLCETKYPTLYYNIGDTWTSLINITISLQLLI